MYEQRFESDLYKTKALLYEPLCTIELDELVLPQGFVRVCCNLLVSRLLQVRLRSTGSRRVVAVYQLLHQKCQRIKLLVYRAQRRLVSWIVAVLHYHVEMVTGRADVLGQGLHSFCPVSCCSFFSFVQL